MDENAKKILKIYSVLFIFLAIWDIVTLVLNYVNEKDELGALVSSGAASQSIVTGSMIALIAVTAVFSLLKLLVGLKGLRFVGGGSAKGLGGLLRFLLIVEIIVLVILLLGSLSGTANWSPILNSLVSVSILVDFSKRFKEAGAAG